jgi:hypothetical protein
MDDVILEYELRALICPQFTLSNTTDSALFSFKRREEYKRIKQKRLGIEEEYDCIKLRSRCQLAEEVPG